MAPSSREQVTSEKLDKTALGKIREKDKQLKGKIS